MLRKIIMMVWRLKMIRISMYLGVISPRATEANIGVPSHGAAGEVREIMARR
jgi:hypothetical protein